MIKNPFSNRGLQFFGRAEELKKMNDALARGQNVVILAPWGVGKTKLFDQYCEAYKCEKKYEVIRCNLLETEDMTGFTDVLLNALASHTVENEVSIFKKVLGRFEPVISTDAFGTVSFTLQKASSSSREKARLDQIASYMVSSDKEYLLYIDEFQQVTRYPNNNAESVLHSFFSSIPKLVCVFSGSYNRIIREMFLTNNRPFYRSAFSLVLNPIGVKEYSDYVIDQFLKNRITIAADFVERVYSLMEGSSWFMQDLFSKVYSKAQRGDCISWDMIQRVLDTGIDDQDMRFREMMKGFNRYQKQMLIRLAHGTQPHVSPEQSNALSSLIEKEYISVMDGSYFFNDKYMLLWLRKTYPEASLK